MPHIDIRAVKRRLFEDKSIRYRICRDYSLDIGLSPNAVAHALLDAFGQLPNTDLDDCGTVSNQIVFRAAARAIGSNSRKWTDFLRSEKQLIRLTSGYEPRQTHERSTEQEIAACLSGQTAGRDAKAIWECAKMLASEHNYYKEIESLENMVCEKCDEQFEVMPSMAVILGTTNPTKQMLANFPPPKWLDAKKWKIEGMGATLASEFLRNLKFSGFKPDRHITRLFELWFPEIIKDKKSRAIALGDKLGTKDKNALKFLTFSLVGVAVTPPDRSFTEVDNLVWALGAYVEKKDKESNEKYWTD